MTVYRAPVRDLAFIANEVLKFDQHRETLGFPDADADTITAILEECARLAEDLFHPVNQSGDEQGCRLENGEVIVPDGFKEAYDAYTQGGWSGLSMSTEHGGQGMPELTRFLTNEIFTAANHSLFMYPSLSEGAYSAISTWGSDEQKATYLPKLASGEWSGTMNLTEAHAGTDVGILRTRAEPQADGSYSISGNKIFISAGEHQMSGNIVHLVLAKLPDAPAGSKGISLFIVPKFLINDDGSLGERNGVRCVSLEHKMGIKGSATCVLEYENAKGFLIGEPNKGLRAMFTMMNGARLAVGMEGVGTAELAYQNAAAYAKDRLQGRALSGPKAADKMADPIIEHADVRRMLLQIRSFTEGARALAGYVALQIDIAHNHPDAAERERADDIVGLMTPVAKSFFTDEGFVAANLAVQVYGGHGYIAEHGIEQFVRDARISLLYEGTNGIQALDLVGRKLALHGGRAVKTYFSEIGALLEQHAGDAELAGYVAPLKAAFESLQSATGWLMKNAAQDPDQLGGTAVDYTRLFSVVAVGAMWLRVAATAASTLADGPEDTDFYKTKLVVGRVFMERYVSEHSTLLARVTSGADAIMALSTEQF